MNKLLIKFLITLIIIVGTDQLTKHYVHTTLTTLNEPITIINNVLSFHLIFNDGVAFGILNQQSFLIVAISIIAILSILFYLFKNYKNINNLETLSWCCVIGGATGNLIDRVFLGYVIDFIKLDFVNFPIFNIADVAINIGIFTLLILIFKKQS